jgi:hypothetical protein
MSKLFITTILTLLVVAASGVGPLFGQDSSTPVEKVSPPPPPYLDPAADHAAWIITLTPPVSASNGSSTPPPNVPKEIHVTKSGDARREITFRNNGSSTVTWFLKGVQLMLDPNFGYAVASGGGGSNPAAIDFPDFAWIDRSNFVGKTSISGVACYVYSHNTIVGNEMAWVDMKTGLPVSMQNYAGRRQYQFNESTESLALPSTFQAAFDRYEKGLEMVKRMQSSTAP